MLKDQLTQAVSAIDAWQASWGAYDVHPSLCLSPDAISAALETYTERLGGNYPFFHPRYAGQMLKPPHPAAVVGYTTAMLINPNNHALDGGPPTAAMEKEVVQELANMFRYPTDTLGHLTSSGTIANLEALWAARSIHPGKAIAFSEEAHYTHGRMCEVIGAEAVKVSADATGRLDLSALETTLKRGKVGTVVLTAGTTGLGKVDPIEEGIALCQAHGVRVHIDAAYGGFFTLIAWAEGETPMREDVARQYRAIAQSDSIAIDPHKHGLQPYGCGCILFRDPSVGRFYKHDSPYTYFTSDELHLGEISLECSRAGAAAGALWFTLQLLPLKGERGLGRVLQATLRAAQQWHALLEESPAFDAFMRPDLDIITFYPKAEKASLIDTQSQHLFERAMNTEQDPVFLSVLRISQEKLVARDARIKHDQPQTRILRSVLMKPEHEHYVPHLHNRLEALMREE